MDLRNENDRRGLIGTILVHSLLILLFIISAFAPSPVDDEEDGGVEVSIGEPDYGGPDEMPATAEAQTQPESSPEQEENPVLSQDEEAPEVKQSVKKTTPKVTTPTETPKTEENKPQERTVNQRATFKKKTGSQGQGDGTQSGNQGRPDGSESGKPDGTGSGKSGSGNWSLSGRSAMSQAKPNPDRSIDATVVVKIWVDKDGTVTKAEAGLRGTTTTDSYFKRISEQAALKWKFSPRKDGDDVQIGSITFVYSQN